MADYKINHMTGRLYKFFTNSPSSYYDDALVVVGGGRE